MSSPSLCDNCLEDFPNKTTPGFCIKCTKVTRASAVPGLEEKCQKIKDWPQCMGCGEASVWTQNPCATCAHGHQEAPKFTGGSTQPLIEEQQRIQETSRRHNSGWFGSRNKPNPHKPNPFPVTDATLGALKLNSLAADNIGIGTEMITVFADPCINTKPIGIFGNFERAVPATMPLETVAEEILKVFNLAWDQGCEQSLSLDSVWVRKVGNTTIDKIPWASPVIILYRQLVSQTMDIASLLPPKISKRRLKGTVMYLKFHIRREMFSDVSTLIDKRARTMFSAVSRPLVSQFSPTDYSNIVQPSASLMGPPTTAPSKDSSVLLCLATIETNPITGQVQVSWPENVDKSRASYFKDLVSSVAHGNGRTKKVYKTTHDDKHYVAKRYFNIGTGTRNQVDSNDNLRELTKEVVRLSQLRFFWDRFVEIAGDTNVDITDFQVTGCLLAQEVLTEDLLPSTALGVSDYQPSPQDITTEKDASTGATNEDSETTTCNNSDNSTDSTTTISSITWLLEPERSTRTKRYSGTNEHLTHNTKDGSTINAFQHFVYLYSQKGLVFADIQTSPSGDPANLADVLFDVMTHTVGFNSGVGDYGPGGIRDFLYQHKCVERCTKLLLEPPGVEDTPAADAKEDDDDEDLYD
ncbi:kinase-like domain-containing protein [Mycena floridula]|nr:kinase-like domain-containing protein [Mycena floridula]